MSPQTTADVAVRDEQDHRAEHARNIAEGLRAAADYIEQQPDVAPHGVDIGRHVDPDEYRRIVASKLLFGAAQDLDSGNITDRTVLFAPGVKLRIQTYTAALRALELDEREQALAEREAAMAQAGEGSA